MALNTSRTLAWGHVPIPNFEDYYLFNFPSWKSKSVIEVELVEVNLLRLHPVSTPYPFPFPTSHTSSATWPTQATWSLKSLRRWWILHRPFRTYTTCPGPMAGCFVPAYPRYISVSPVPFGAFYTMVKEVIIFINVWSTKNIYSIIQYFLYIFLLLLYMCWKMYKCTSFVFCRV